MSSCDPIMTFHSTQSLSSSVKPMDVESRQWLWSVSMSTTGAVSGLSRDKTLLKGTLARNFTTYYFGPITKIRLFKDFV